MSRITGVAHWSELLPLELLSIFERFVGRCEEDGFSQLVVGRFELLSLFEQFMFERLDLF